MDVRPIPEAALRDKNSVEMLRVWIAEGQMYCSIKVGMYEDSANISEGRAWGILLADVTRHLANAILDEYSVDRSDSILEIKESYLQELGKPTTKVSGEFA
jgi:hypothetical protein